MLWNRKSPICAIFSKPWGRKSAGIGTRRLRIRGVRILRDAQFWVPPDRIVAGTYLYAAAATRGKVEFLDVPVDEIASILRVYEKMGGPMGVQPVVN